MKTMKKTVSVFFLILFVGALFSGCASSKKSNCFGCPKWSQEKAASSDTKKAS